MTGISQTIVQNYFVSLGNNDSINVISWNMQETKYIDGRRVYKTAEQMPQFPGGNDKAAEFVKKNLKEDPDEKFVPEIKLTFVIDTDGVCKNVGIIKKEGDGKLTKIEISAIKTVMQMPKWKTGVSQGAAVPIQYYLPISL